MSIEEEMLQRYIDKEDERIDRKMNSVSTLLHCIYYNLDDVEYSNDINDIKEIVKNEMTKIKDIQQRVDKLNDLNF